MLIIVTDIMVYGPFASLDEVREKIKQLELPEDGFDVQVLWG